MNLAMSPSGQSSVNASEASFADFVRQV